MKASLFKQMIFGTMSLIMAGMTHVGYAQTGNWFFSVDAEALWANVGNSTTVDNGSDFPAPANVDFYSVNNNTQASPGIALSSGYRWQRNQKYIPSYLLAVRYQHLFNHQITGTVEQNSLPEFTNYSFGMGTTTDVVSAYSKIDLFQYNRIMPYIDGGIGAAFNHTTRYQEAASPGVTQRVSPAFTQQTRNTFAYNVGAGIDVILTPQVIMSVGYDYQSFGALASGYGQTTWANTQLDLGRLSANTALVGITYLSDFSTFFHQ